MFIVSFNDGCYEVGGYEEGDTQDYYGPDVDRLAKHVCETDSSFPLVFVPSDENSCEEGYFYPIDDEDKEYQVAVMYKGTPTTPIFVP